MAESLKWIVSLSAGDPGTAHDDTSDEPSARRLAAVPLSEMCEACLDTCGGLALSHLPNGTWQVLPPLPL